MTTSQGQLMPSAYQFTAEDRSKGGMQSTPAKRLAAKIREAKKRGVPDADVQQIMDMIMYPEFTSWEVLDNLRMLKRHAEENNNVGLLLAVNNQLISWQKVNQGSPQVQISIDQRQQTIQLDHFTQVYEQYHGKAKASRPRGKSGERKGRKGNKQSSA